MGTYNQGPPPPRQYSFSDLMLALAVLIAFIVIVGTSMFVHRRMHRAGRRSANMKSFRALIFSLFLILVPAGLAYADGGALYVSLRLRDVFCR